MNSELSEVRRVKKALDIRERTLDNSIERNRGRRREPMGKKRSQKQPKMNECKKNNTYCSK